VKEPVIFAIQGIIGAIKEKFGDDGEPRKPISSSASTDDDRIWQELLQLAETILHVTNSGGGTWGDIVGNLVDQLDLAAALAEAKKAGDDAQDDIDDHILDQTNPHNVTKSQVGLGDVDNTSDEDKPVSTAQATAIGKKLEMKTSYADTSWEWFKPESDGGGHWFWDYTTGILRFDGFNNDPASPIVWESYEIEGGGPNFVTAGGSRKGIRRIIAWDGGAPGVGKIRFYVTVDQTTSAFAEGDEVATHTWTMGIIPNENGKPRPTVATHDDLALIDNPKINDWVYVQDDTHEDPNDPGTNIHVGETWSYAYDGSDWIALVKINELQIQDDETSIGLDSNGKRSVKDGGITSSKLAPDSVIDAKIGERTLVDEAESDSLISIAAKTLTQWLQGIRNNLKYLLNHFIATVNGRAPVNGNVAVTVDMTEEDFQALEDPPGSGLYPSLKGQIVRRNDVEPYDGVLIEKPNVRATNRIVVPITANNQSWLATDDGIIVAKMTFNSVPNSSGSASILQVNGQGVAGSVIFNNSTYIYEWSANVQVAKDDIVSISYTTSWTATYISAYFYPNKWVWRRPPIQAIEIGTDYSLEEKPVMVMDAVTKEIRQKLDTDGSPVWTQTFEGTYNLVANTRTLIVLPIAIKRLIKECGEWQHSGNDTMGWGHSAPTGNGLDVVYEGYAVTNAGALRLTLRSPVNITNGKYRITFEYTKP
jgi:hypothetical protein